MASKPKPHTSSFILFLIALLVFTIYYLRQLHDCFQSAVTYSEPSTNPDWYDVIARDVGDERMINIGLLNMDGDETAALEAKGKVVKVELEPLDKGVQWSDLFPEWINESSTMTSCPELSMPEFGRYEELDVVVARVPCNKCEESGWRDVARLHVNLVVANLLVRSGRVGSGRPLFAVFVGCCGPMWEIFRCDDLLLRVADSWIYKPQLRRLKQIVRLPVGTCQVTPPSPQSGEELSEEKAREAYVTVLHSSEAYVCGAIALAQSIIQTNTTRELVLLADDHVSPESMNGLRAAGWKIKRIRRIRSPHSRKDSYNEWNYSKLRLWQLVEYDKVMFIDADLIVTRNLDGFFGHPQISAAGNDRHMFNSGLMLLEPSACTFRTLMKRRWLVRSYNGGDQGYLNEMFPWWHRLPKKINHLKFFPPSGDGHYEHRIPDDAYALHYLGLKPWMCYKDYDCNWDKAITQIFASDSANQRWWRVYDTMPKSLRRFCALTPKADARIRKHRIKAKRANFADGHWRIKVHDPRQII
ncbi:putative UDP-glucuronate:xylan alpha-glucuronosyltransferase 4 [Salvia miltiorrhiza]|uniref:putative UDP-glucuronate:xylan alpha-glucuronosyltransferase 4 n=1 Tax=Salvia miltiorrhiza TaxID=226208 RepID=UPI0025AD1C57|nr:putative UDP-glucuronate:xylan alpha-glucuronosyltransferase 4 [Salvia miltiorrhiza]